MPNVLVQHAIDNVWCTPSQDRQYIIKPARVTHMGGTYGRVKVNFDWITLPNSKDKFHVFQIGQLNPELINIMEVKSTWFPISRLCREHSLILDLYTVDGYQYPRFESWIMLTENKNIIFAIKEQPKINRLINESLYLRFYSNAFFASARKNDQNDNYIFVYGKHIKNSNDINDIIVRVNERVNHDGKTYGFINGCYTTTLNSTNIVIGDLVEIIHDTSIYQTLEFKVSLLDTYNSTLLENRRYLLHSETLNTSSIIFNDDIDIYLYKTTNTVDKGLYFHRNAANVVTNVTHKDWGIGVQALQAYVSNNTIFSSLEEVNLRIHIRKSGYARPIVDEASNIKELYKLPAEDVRRALTGIDSTIPEWTATYLENSPYIRLMNSTLSQITPNMVEQAYGYSAVSSLLGTVVQEVSYDGETYTFPIPESAKQVNRNYVWGYTGGKLMPAAMEHPITYYYNNETEYPTLGGQNVDIVEIIGVYQGAKKYVCEPIPEPSRETVAKYIKGTNYRCYKCNITVNGPTFDWTDVTGTSDYHIETLEDESFYVRWNISTSAYLCLVIVDTDILVGSITIAPDNGYLQFSVNPSSYFNGNPYEVHMPPLGSLEVWCNGYSLVEGIDYIVNYPQVTIISKKHINGNKTDMNVIQYRGMGFCDTDCVYRSKADVGWIKYGQLSRNNRYDLREGRNNRFIVNSTISPRENVEFAEDGVIYPEDGSSLSGTPYAIIQLDPPLFNLVETPIYGYRKIDESRQTRMANYLDTKKAQPPNPDVPTVVLDFYQLYSPFTGAIINAILDNDLDPALYTNLPSNSAIADAVSPYLPLLAIDPTQASVGSLLDFSIVKIHPHASMNVISLNFGQWRFLKRVVDIYTKGKVDISHFISIVN